MSDEKPMDADEMTRAIVDAFENDDAEGGHMHADKLLCEKLRALGYGDAVDAFERATRWYA